MPDTIGDQTGWNPADNYMDYGQGDVAFNPSAVYGNVDTSSGFDWSGALKNIGGLFTGSTGGPFGQMAAFGGLAALLNKVLSSDAQKPVGYQGGIPGMTATRQQIARPADYQPGMGGISYFTPMQYQYTGQDLGGGRLGVTTGATAQGADPLTQFIGALGTAVAAAPAASPAPAPTPSAAPAPSPATQVTTPATQTGTTMKTQGVTGGTAADTATKKTATTATTTGWIPGMTMDYVQWRNAKTGETRMGSSSDRPPSSDWSIASTTTTLPGIGGTTADTTSATTGGTAFNMTSQQVADAARQAAAQNPNVAAQAAAQQPPATAVESYFKNPFSASKLDEIANKSTYTVGQNIIKSGQVGVKLNDDGEPAEFIYYAPDGSRYTNSAFLPKEFLKYANQFNINPTDLLGIEKGLTANKIAFKPYEYFGGTGSDHGFDFRDFLTGGMGTAYDWTKDPMAAFKGPTGLSSLKEAQDIASKFGLKYNQEKYKGGGIDISQATQLQGGKTPPKPWAVQGPGNGFLSWYDTEDEANAAAKQYQGKVVDLSGRSVTSQDNANNLTRDDKGNWVLKPGGAAGGLGSIIRGHAAGGLPALQSAGGRFLRGPGDGVSDSIEAKFDRSGQPARLADGEFVLDARTVSEIGNGSSEAGARKLYAMMDRIHKARKKAGRGKDSGADKYLPA